jgi:hypothetical protein
VDRLPDLPQRIRLRGEYVQVDRSGGRYQRTNVAKIV